MRKAVAWILLAVFLLGWQPAFLGAAPAEEETEKNTAASTRTAGLKLNVKGAVLMDPQSGKILWEQNAHYRGYPASMTKLMTMVVTMDAVARGEASLDDPVETSERAESFGGAEVFLEQGETVPLEKMLIALAVASANDASVAVAEHIAGTEEAFVELMNAKVQELGLKNTHFTNCHGLHDPNHYTTPYDMALVARYALKYPKILEWTSIKRYTFRQDPLTILDTTNKMLYWYPGTDGFKTGYTEAAGLNLVSTVERDGLRLIAVVMGVETPQGHFTESMKLYNWAFRQWAWKKIYGPGEVVAEVATNKGQEEKLRVVAAGKVGAVVPRSKVKQDGLITTRLVLPRVINAPVVQGQKVGEIIILEEGREIGRTDLVAEKSIPRASLRQVIQRAIRAVFTVRQ
ncbi:D-alanyl-D-alanine carboxypeptidase family protein [Thermanaeromonas sp. C210]|uniref:D-alanyl-D-alanine carboxypeptidase family protein n=1 Tax=Thermanaeromonas sp. C210 TaxID=2731925 RepID=UPI00155D2CAA|nr:D-alanyl-D-alanine carboxypeptidase family protein [Thermanaeromonas sp. C210]GFN23342.1 serine-type D-Ala-D-Ala carboxypeptidase [Thermanaeromonas sp. C210]